MKDHEAIEALWEFVDANVDESLEEHQPLMGALSQTRQMLDAVHSQKSGDTIRMIDEALNELGYVAPFFVSVGLVRDRLTAAGMSTALVTDAELAKAMERAVRHLEVEEVQKATAQMIADQLVEKDSLWEADHG
jgi:preprotein translocase subunit SecD